MDGRFLLQQVLLLLFGCVAIVQGIGVINSKGCLNFYNEDGLLYDDGMMSYGKAAAHCKKKTGSLPMPTETSWDAFLEYIRLNRGSDELKNEGTWIGVTVTRIKDSKYSIVDSDGLELDDGQTELMFNDLSKFALPIGHQRCVTYDPPIKGREGWSFGLQSCTEGGPLARVACRCISVIQKYVPKSPPAASEIPLPDKSAQSEGNNNNNNNTSSLVASGRAWEGDHVETDESGNEVSNSTTPLGALIGVLGACCVIATAYFVTKKSGWNLRERISRSMPYNRPRRSVNGDTYHRGQELSEISISENRPIHVYEEIILRNSAAPPTSRDVVLSSSSSLTMPQLPPPEPPYPCPLSDFALRRDERLTRSLEDGYLQPSFRRQDTIPGDVRSPPPMNTNMFTFPPTNLKKNSLLQVPGEKELKYASVETVQTLLDGEEPTNEEYLVDDQDNVIDEREKQFGSLVVDIPDEKAHPSTSENRKSTTNSYVLINEGISPGLTNHEEHKDTDSSPVFMKTTEYENERFLRTLTKAPPVKPKRRGQVATAGTVLETLPSPNPNDQTVVYSRIPSTSNEPVYSKVKRKRERNDSKTAVRASGVYTPMRGTTFREERPSEPISSFSDSEFSDFETSVAEDEEEPESSAHEYHTVNRGNPFISAPQIMTTTNKDLANSTLACYEIPPEEDA